MVYTDCKLWTGVNSKQNVARSWLINIGWLVGPAGATKYWRNLVLNYRGMSNKL